MKPIRIGDYVQVKKQPKGWDGSGEIEYERTSLVGHVGVVVHIDVDEDFYLVRFTAFQPRLDDLSFVRNIERRCLRRLTRQPVLPLASTYFFED